MFLLGSCCFPLILKGTFGGAGFAFAFAFATLRSFFALYLFAQAFISCCQVVISFYIGKIALTARASSLSHSFATTGKVEFEVQS